MNRKSKNEILEIVTVILWGISVFAIGYAAIFSLFLLFNFNSPEIIAVVKTTAVISVVFSLLTIFIARRVKY